MNIARNGQVAVLVSIALFASAVIFRDFFVEAALLVVLIIIGSEAAFVGIATRKPETKFVLTHEDSSVKKRRVVLRRGERTVEQIRLEKKVGGEVELESRVSFLDLGPKVVRRTGVSAL